MIALNVIAFLFSAWVTSTCRTFTWVWWLNAFAAFINLALVIAHFTGVW